VRVRRFVLLTHRWMGLSTSVIAAVVGTTGALIIWFPQTNLLRRIAGKLHQDLALGGVGWWLVVLTTIIAVVLEIGGLILWWKRKSMTVRLTSGWKRALTDLHHPMGLLGWILMTILAVTGVGMSFVLPDDHPELRRIVADFHTARNFSLPVRIVYSIATLGFLVQAASGVAMWWKSRL